MPHRDLQRSRWEQSGGNLVVLCSHCGHQRTCYFVRSVPGSKEEQETFEAMEKDAEVISCEDRVVKQVLSA